MTNEQKYKTVHERVQGYMQFCTDREMHLGCRKCEFRGTGKCIRGPVLDGVLRWLEMEADPDRTDEE